MERKKIIDSIVKNILKEQYIKEQFNIKEEIEYDPEHPERMHSELERKLRNDEHIFGKSKSFPSTNLENYSQRMASKRFKDVIQKVKSYHGVNDVRRVNSRFMSVLMEIHAIERNHKDALEQLAIDIVSEEFDIPEGMLEVELVAPGTNISINFDEEEEEVPSEGLVPVIEAQAVVFPLLVHELIKGALELSAINWGGDHLDFEEQKGVLRKTDTLENEVWGMRLGPIMWEKFLKCIPPEDYDIKQWIFRELSKLPAQQFHEFMKEIISGSQRCGEIIETLKELHYEDEGEEEYEEEEYEGEEEEEEYEDEEDGEIDYSNMSKREIQDLINDALDDGDFDLIRKLKDYL